MTASGHRRIRSLAWLAWGLTVALAAGAMIIRVVSRAPIPENRGQLSDASFIALGVLTVAFTTMGLVIVLRRPRHPVGRALFVLGGLYAVSAAAGAVTFHLLATSVSRAPLTLWMAWLMGITFSLAGLALFVLIWLFPDGRSPFRAPWMPSLLATSIAIQVAWSFAGRNWVIPALPSPVTLPAAIGPAIGTLAPPLTAGLGGVAMIAIVVFRFRRARGTERQQLKWFASAALLAVATLVISAAGASLMPRRGAPLGELPVVAFLLAQALIPIAVAIAILRYRLYDIDRIIGRTLVYGSLTALLAAAYGVTVLVLSALFAPLTGGDSLAVAAATLAVAALFQPIRRRLQLIVDRRFFRARYDAAQIVDGFAAALRDQVDLEQLTGELRSVVARTMQPASAAVWLRAVRDRPISRS